MSALFAFTSDGESQLSLHFALRVEMRIQDAELGCGRVCGFFTCGLAIAKNNGRDNLRDAAGPGKNNRVNEKRRFSAMAPAPGIRLQKRAGKRRRANPARHRGAWLIPD